MEGQTYSRHDDSMVVPSNALDHGDSHKQTQCHGEKRKAGAHRDERKDHGPLVDIAVGRRRVIGAAGAGRRSHVDARVKKRQGGYNLEALLVDPGS